MNTVQNIAENLKILGYFSISIKDGISKDPGIFRVYLNGSSREPERV